MESIDMTMKNPDKILPKSAKSLLPPFPQTIFDPSMRVANFDQILQNRGIRFLHSRATPCPNMTNLNTSNHSPNCPICDGNGFLYYDEREIMGVFYSNSLDKIYEAQGVWETGSAIITFPNYYFDENGVVTDVLADFNAYDKLVVPDYEVRLWELTEFVVTGNEPTTLNTTRLRYPISSIDNMSYVTGNTTLVTLVADTDYTIDAQGRIEWILGKSPAAGTVLTISYYAVPVYNVVQLLHEQRVSQEMQPNGTKKAIRIPQQVLVKRDFLMNSPQTINE